jgi:putative FmdB family regulatory protein
MPVYEYRCSKCEKVFEKMQKFADEPLTIHEDCGGPVERLISAPGLHFKGSGWYITDYARSGSGSKRDSVDDSSRRGKSESEAKSHESKSGESKSGESKSSESKSGESKSGESRSSESHSHSSDSKSEKKSESRSSDSGSKND